MVAHLPHLTLIFVHSLSDLFCKDIPGEAARTVRDLSGKQSLPMAPFTVTLGRVQHTIVYEKLQSFIHAASSYPDELIPEELTKFLALVLTYLDEQDTTQTMNRTLAYMLLQLALLIGKCVLAFMCEP